jgi:hypothetical protein
MIMKWILIGCIGMVITACSSKKSGEELLKEFRRKAALTYCECVFTDTTRIINRDSCGVETANKMERLKTEDKQYASLNTTEFEYFMEPEMEQVCPGFKELLGRQIKRLEARIREMAEDDLYLQATTNEFSGKLLSWEKLPKGEGEYEIVVRSAKDSTTRTFISQAHPPKDDDADIIYVIFEPNEAAYHEKYPFRAVQVRFVNKK